MHFHNIKYISKTKDILNIKCIVVSKSMQLMETMSNKNVKIKHTCPRVTEIKFLLNHSSLLRIGITPCCVTSHALTYSILGMHMRDGV